MKRFFIALVSACALLTGAATAQVQVGQTAPDFTVNHLGQKDRNLSSYFGRTIVLEWINTGCPFVRAQYDSGKMQALQAKYGDRVVWLTIASSAPGTQGYFNPTDWKPALQKENWKGDRLVIDPAGKIGRLYGAKTTPHMFVIDSNGKIAYQGAIDDRKERNYVSAALEALMAGRAVEVTNTQAYGCAIKYPE